MLNEERLEYLRIKNSILKYGCLKNKLKTLYLTGKHLWEYEFPSIIYCPNSVDEIINPNINIHNRYLVYLKVSIIPRDLDKLTINVYNIYSDKYSNACYDYLGGFDLNKKYYGKTWWAIKEEYRKIFIEEYLC